MGLDDIPLTKATRALFGRLLFVIHGLISIWRVVAVSNNPIYWSLALILIVIFIEGALIIFTRRGNENRWFCVCIFLYLCAVIPSLWFLQLELSPANRALKQAKANITVSIEMKNVDDSYKENAKIEFGGISVSVHIPIDNELWLQLLQQTMLVTVILGRWILPKGDITRDQLSQLLLVFLAMGADIVELFDTFKESIVRNNLHLTFVVLGVWTVSLMQFPLVLTGGRTASGLPESTNKRGGQKSGNIKKATSNLRAMLASDGQRKGSTDTTDSTAKLQSSNIFNQEEKDNMNKNEKEHSMFVQILHLLADDMSFWSIMTSTFLQDGPYLVTRLYLLIVYQTNSFTMIFFTCKNILVVILQWYRLMVISCEYRQRVRYAAYFKSYYDAAHAESSAPTSTQSSPIMIAARSAKNSFSQLTPTSPESLRKSSSASVISTSTKTATVGRPRGRSKAGANLAGLRNQNPTPLEEEEVVVEQEDHEENTTPLSSIIIPDSSDSYVSSFGKSSYMRQSYGSLSATALPYYFTSLAAMSPSISTTRLFRQVRSCDDDSGVDVMFLNEPISHYF